MESVLEKSPSRLGGEEVREADDLCRLLLELAYQQARARGLNREDGEDCAAEFAERMLGGPALGAAAQRDGHCFHAWLRRCAQNYVTDFCRAKARRSRYE